MRYITGIHALNLSCALETCGDWHMSALKWRDLTFKDSEDSFLSEYGIEANREIPETSERFFVANHIRALLDLLLDGNFSVAQGMRDDFICNEVYTQEIFIKVSEIMRHVGVDLARKIDEFMCREYKLDWLKFKEG